MFKRPRAVSTSVSTISDSTHNVKDGNKTDNKQISKKKKADSLEQFSFSKHLESAKEFVECNKTKYPIDFDKLMAFLETTRGSPTTNTNIIEIARLFTSDFAQLSVMLTDVYQYTTNRKCKSRITRIRNLLNNDPTTNQYDSEQYSTD